MNPVTQKLSEWQKKKKKEYANYLAYQYLSNVWLHNRDASFYVKFSWSREKRVYTG